MEASRDVSATTTQTQTDGCIPEVGGATSKEESGANTLSSTERESCDNKKGLPNLTETPSAAGPTAESAGGVALKVATTVLHPVCLGDSPLMLPIHLQMSGASAPQLSQMGSAPYLITSQSPVSLPLVLDQQVIQHVNPSLIPQTANCAQLPLPNTVLCQNPLAFGLPPAAEQKSAAQAQDVNLLSLLQNPAFAAILQDLFPPQAGSTPCQSPGSTFFALPPLTPPYSSPLAPLVPPATLLVPYPVIIPLPVPLPIPLPIPIPVPQSEDSKMNMTKPVCTVSRSTQTYPHNTTSAMPSSRKGPTHTQTQTVSSPSCPADEGQVLDLSVRPCPVQPKQEYIDPTHQENVLDLSVPGVRKKCLQPAREGAPAANQKAGAIPLPLGTDCIQGLDSKLLGSLASLEFSRKHKWLVDSSAGGSSSTGPDASLSGSANLEILSTSQTAKVIVSVKDAIPAILCGKLKGLSGVSTKNFSITRDGNQAASLQQFYGVPSGSRSEQHNANDPLKKVPKSRAIKLKKVGSQEIHFLPIKKQRLAALLPRK
ncbi:retinoic acid-induced protein 2 [Gouania willdenowi]|uniref:Retinoic acid induced 2 n=1 Tax=Gouania willdenowi TaxID=441366 RepID=A0A8C5DTI6_GOUWI|nr:retinoic acid-induced protein 2 [Gouania willdenowi]